MTNIEKRARKIVRDAYWDYLDDVCADETKSGYSFKVYYHYLQFLKALFPDTTDEDVLERKWRSMYKKENNYD